MSSKFIEVTQEVGAAFVNSNVQGEIVMLNLLRFRELANYSGSPELAPERPISGQEAYHKYIAHTMPFLEKVGSTILFKGKGSRYLIGPQDKRWDFVLLVRHSSIIAFMSFASNAEYLAGVGHRTAALEDSRLLPIIEETTG